MQSGPDFIIGTPKSKSAELRKEKSAENADLRRGIKKELGVFFHDSFIRGEGLIPRPSGAITKVLNPRPIPFKNNIPRCSAAGLLIFKTLFSEI